MMMPARLALALQADGWWLRSDIIWAKPNPMPESVTDRPTNAHEHIYLLSKSPRYFYDSAAVAEPLATPPHAPGNLATGRLTGDNCVNQSERVWGLNGTRSLRNVWTIATAPFSEAHFATFPPELAERCIKAGTSEKGCCAQCGAPWVRETEFEYRKHRPSGGTLSRIERGNKVHDDGFGGWGSFGTNLRKDVTTTGWSPGCKCNAPTRPCTVLDPFAGAGTVGLVADRLQRNAVLIELNPAYAAMARNRITDDAGMFAEVAD